MNVDYFDVLDLAAAMLNRFDDYEEEEIEVAFYEEFGMTVEQFGEVAEKLMSFIDVGESGLTGKRYKGFATQGFFHIKKEITK